MPEPDLAAIKSDELVCAGCGHTDKTHFHGPDFVACEDAKCECSFYDGAEYRAIPYCAYLLRDSLASYQAAARAKWPGITAFDFDKLEIASRTETGVSLVYGAGFRTFVSHAEAAQYAQNAQTKGDE